MNKKGFTLIELLAVIVILAVVMLIGSTSIAGIRDKMNKNMFESKIDLIIGSAKTWGQDNKGELTSPKTMTVGQLIEIKYVDTEEKVPQSEYTSCEVLNKVGTDCLVVTNNYDGSVINALQLQIYIEYNRVYACILKNTNNKNVLKENNSWSEFGDLNYYCS